jgi:hypothetical protein
MHEEATEAMDMTGGHLKADAFFEWRCLGRCCEGLNV